MGLFDRFKKQTKSQQPAQRRGNIYTMPILNSEEEIMAFNVEKLNTIQHSNNELTDLMMARILKQNPENTMYMDLADFITFEIPNGMEINDYIMQLVMNRYIQGQSENYIGRLMQDSNGHLFGNKSGAVQNIVNQTIQQRIEAKREQVEKRLQERQQAEANANEEFKERMDARSYLDSIEEEKFRRRMNPTLERVYSHFEKQGQKSYTNYDGVNLNTGDILRVRKVDKVGKDASGTYLYSAYINNTTNEHDVELLGDIPQGYAVCFELQKKLEDIVKDGEIGEITRVLQLLSDGRNFENPNQLTYIGEIDKNWHVDRRESSSSSAIQATIVKLQRQFQEKIQQQWRENY